ncbi:hypothetical protein DPEC_G00358740 [Dallia pectoralis]|uniref:Uncharacterized protein n=1 Tax=Dallia pectoralis TaxID=75939 RepID=A0ACC2F0F2_DALPE|nr:hypothetical protein DPEC_G00358740 [Dallia pectoralis]
MHSASAAVASHPLIELPVDRGHSHASRVEREEIWPAGATSLFFTHRSSGGLLATREAGAPDVILCYIVLTGPAQIRPAKGVPSCSPACPRPRLRPAKPRGTISRVDTLCCDRRGRL